MNAWFLATASAFWLGLMTSISPCPLAANIAAMSYVGREVGSRRRTVLAGLLYTLGRTLSYVALAAILVGGLLSVPQVALFLQRHMNRLLGPLLIVVGLALLDIVPLPSFGGGISARWATRMKKAGALGTVAFGAACALAFCPVSAALFFGSLVPLALDRQSPLWMPGVYGVGTGLPVVAFAVLLGAGVQWMGRAFRRISAFELWAGRVTAVVILGVGLYYTWTFALRRASTL